MIGRLLSLFAVQTVAYVVLVLNIRALNRSKYAITWATDVGYAMLSFYLIRRVVEARTWEEVVAYAVGSGTGSVIAIWLTRHWK